MYLVEDVAPTKFNKNYMIISKSYVLGKMMYCVEYKNQCVFNRDLGVAINLSTISEQDILAMSFE